MVKKWEAPLYGTMQGPSWGYFKVIFYQVCKLLTATRNKMPPRTGKRLQDRGRDTPTKGLMWLLYRGTLLLRRGRVPMVKKWEHGISRYCPGGT